MWPSNTQIPLVPRLQTLNLSRKLKPCWYQMLLCPVWICIPRTFCFQNRSSNFTPDYMTLAVSETDDITHQSIQCVPACITPFLPNGKCSCRDGQTQTPLTSNTVLDRCTQTAGSVSRFARSCRLHIETEDTDQLLIPIPLKAAQVTSRTQRMQMILHAYIFSDR